MKLALARSKRLESDLVQPKESTDDQDEFAVGGPLQDVDCSFGTEKSIIFEPESSLIPRSGSGREPDAHSLTKYYLHHFWEGRQVLFLQGRFFCGTRPDLKYKFLSLALIVATYCLYLTFANQYVYTRINTWLPWLTNYLFFLSLVFYFLASSSDPGAIPPRQFLQLERLYAWRRAEKEQLVWQHATRKKCRSCLVYRPPRSNHCS